MRAAVTLLVLLFSTEGAQTRGTQSQFQSESQRSGVATAVAAASVSTQRDVSTEINDLKKAVFDLQTQMLNVTSLLETTQIHLEILRNAYRNLEQVTDAQQLDITTLKTRLDTSEAEVENLTGQNAAIIADMNIVRTELTTQTEVNAAQESELERVNTRLATGEANVEDLKWENRVQNDELAELKAGLEETIAEVEAIKAGTTGTPKVAFSAGLLDYTGYVEAGDTRRSLIFRKITTNVGRAYSDITGVFRAPVRGVYYFRFTVKDYLAARYMDISMWRNAQQVLWLDGYDTDGHAAYLSTGTTLQLEAGDAINMRIRAGSRIYDSHGEHSTFSGFLLFTL